MTCSSAMPASSRSFPTEPHWLPPAAAVAFNRLLAGRAGRMHALRDPAMLRQALASPWNLWVYSKTEDPAALAAALFVDLANAGAFAHANTATAFLCMVAFLEANGYCLALPDAPVAAEKLRDFAARRFGERALADWLRDWIERRVDRTNCSTASC